MQLPGNVELVEFLVQRHVEAEQHRIAQRTLAATTLQRLFRCGRIGPLWYRRIGRRANYIPRTVEHEVWLTYMYSMAFST